MPKLNPSTRTRRRVFKVHAREHIVNSPDGFARFVNDLNAQLAQISDELAKLPSIPEDFNADDYVKQDDFREVLAQIRQEDEALISSDGTFDSGPTDTSEADDAGAGPGGGGGEEPMGDAEGNRSAIFGTPLQAGLGVSSISGSGGTSERPRIRSTVLSQPLDAGITGRPDLAFRRVFLLMGA